MALLQQAALATEAQLRPSLGSRHRSTPEFGLLGRWIFPPARHCLLLLEFEFNYHIAAYFQHVTTFLETRLTHLRTQARPCLLPRSLQPCLQVRLPGLIPGMLAPLSLHHLFRPRLLAFLKGVIFQRGNRELSRHSCSYLLSFSPNSKDPAGIQALNIHLPQPPPAPACACTLLTTLHSSRTD